MKRMIDSLMRNAREADDRKSYHETCSGSMLLQVVYIRADGRAKDLCALHVMVCILTVSVAPLR